MLLGCIEQAYQDGAGLAPIDTGTSSTSTGEPTTPTMSGGGGSGVQTVTGEESTSPSGGSMSVPGETGSSGAPVNAPPTIESFVADPPHLNEAGASELKLMASDDVVVARLSLNGEQIFEGPPEKFPFVYEALSAKFNFPHTFGIEVEDAEGLTASDTTELTVQLPQPGAEKCLFKDAGANASVGRSPGCHPRRSPRPPRSTRAHRAPARRSSWRGSSASPACAHVSARQSRRS